MQRPFTASVARQGVKRVTPNSAAVSDKPPVLSDDLTRTVCGQKFTGFQCMHHWSGGSSYYFSEAEMARLHPPGSVNAQHIRLCGAATGATVPRRGDSSGGIGAGGGGGATQDASQESSKTTATVHGNLGNYCIDLTIPLLHREELERWELEGYLHRKGFNSGTRLARSTRLYRTLLPPDAPVTYLGEEIQRIDQAHRHRGYFTVSEVAEVFIPLVPTFPVETRYVTAQLPPHLIRKIEENTPIGTSMAMGLFGRYPLIFQFLPSRYRRALVQLNPAHWFVRQHPGYGKADKALQQFRAYSESSDLSLSTYLGPGAGSEPEEVAGKGRQRPTWRARLLGVLASQLPRKATPVTARVPAGSTTGTATPDTLGGHVYVKERYVSRNLVDWISSFPPEQLEFINESSELHVLHFISQHVYIFQLMSLEKGDHNLFVEAHVFLAGTDEPTNASGSASVARGAAAASSPDAADEAEDGLDEEEDGAAGGSWWTANSEGAPAERGAVAGGDGEAGREDPPAAPKGSSPETLQRERSFKQAVADELIGLDDLAAGVEGAEQDDVAGAGVPGDADAPLRDYDGDDGDAAGEFNDADADGHGGHRGAASAERQEWVRTALRQQQQQQQEQQQQRYPGTDGRGRQALGSDAEETTAFGLPIEKIYIRRLPPDVAPRSLSDLDQDNSPDPELVRFAASFLGSPRSRSGQDQRCFFRDTRKAYKVPVTELTEVWRWVPVERIYAALSAEQRQHLRQRYKGLVNFLRYHGKVFELSSDYSLVIAHDPEGTLAPIPHLQRSFKFAHRVVLPPDFDDNPNVSVELLGESARKVFARVLGEGSTPTCRRHMLLVDPDNPMMNHQTLYDEIANLTPRHPILMRELLLNLPPIMRACLPNTVNLNSSRRLETYMEKSQTMVRHRDKFDPVLSGRNSHKAESMSAEDAVAELLQVPFGTEGLTIRAAIKAHLSRAAVDSLADHFGSVTRALRMLPQYFEMQDLSDGRKRLVLVRRK